MKVHAEREIDLDEQVIDEDLPDGLLDGEGGASGGKRKRRRKSEASKEGPGKLRRIDSGLAGKEWVCEEDGCDKSFKTVSVIVVLIVSLGIAYGTSAWNHGNSGNPLSMLTCRNMP